MENIKDILVNNILNSYYKNIKIPVDHKLLNIFYCGNHDSDYILKSLIGLQKFLKSKQIDLTLEEIYKDITQTIDLSDFDINLQRNNLNINLKKNFIEKNIKNLLMMDNILPKCTIPKNILVDFSSPNIAKDMHVGHLRSTIIGDTLCKLFEMQGHNVSRINHLGDYGLQFGMIISYLLEKYPNYKEKNITISDLQVFYTEAKKRFDTDEIFKKLSYERVVELQSGNKQILEAWDFIKKISKISYDEIYDRLDIKLVDVGESFYQSKIPFLIKELNEKNLLIDDNGRKIIKIEGIDLPLTVIKSDGGYTYDTTDLAALRYRLVDLNMDKIFYVIDKGQALHLELIFKLAKEIGWLKPFQEVKHISFGLVLGYDGKRLRSRNGDTIKLTDMLDESIIESTRVFESLKTERISKIINSLDIHTSLIESISQFTSDESPHKENINIIKTNINNIMQFLNNIKIKGESQSIILENIPTYLDNIKSSLEKEKSYGNDIKEKELNFINGVNKILYEFDQIIKALHSEKENSDSISPEEKNIIITNVAYGSIKYADLSTTRTNDYTFSFDKMLSLKGNTGAYQLYMYARICAILRNANDYLDEAKNNINDFILTDIREIILCKLILQLPEIIERINNDQMFHVLCNYLYDLSEAFSKFHFHCRCLNYNDNKELINVNYSRLIICIVTKKVIETCFYILGINKLTKM